MSPTLPAPSPLGSEDVHAFMSDLVKEVIGRCVCMHVFFHVRVNAGAGCDVEKVCVFFVLHRSFFLFVGFCSVRLVEILCAKSTPDLVKEVIGWCVLCVYDDSGGYRMELVDCIMMAVGIALNSLPNKCLLDVTGRLLPRHVCVCFVFFKCNHEAFQRVFFHAS